MTQAISAVLLLGVPHLRFPIKAGFPRLYSHFLFFDFMSYSLLTILFWFFLLLLLLFVYLLSFGIVIVFLGYLNLFWIIFVFISYHYSFLNRVLVLIFSLSSNELSCLSFLSFLLH